MGVWGGGGGGGGGRGEWMTALSHQFQHRSM